MKHKSQKKQWKILLIGLFVLTIIGGCASPPTAKPPGSYTTTASDGTSIRYDVAGQGETALLFVHCWTCNRSFWDHQFDYFSEHYRVVRLDLAAHGESGQSRTEYTMASFGADVATVAEALDLNQIILIGHSMGGPVSVEASKILGDRVAGVVGVDTFYTGFPYPQDDAGIQAFTQPFVDNFHETSAGMVRSMFPASTDKKIVDKVLAVTQAAHQEMAISAMIDIFHWNRDEGPQALKALGNKLHNINGEPMNKDVPPHPSVRKIANTGHFPLMEKPHEFNQALTDIVNELLHPGAQ